MTGRDLDGQERTGLQQMWFDYVCNFCHSWHMGGVPRSIGGYHCRDGLCPRTSGWTETRGPGPNQGSYTMGFWQDGKWNERPDDFTWEEVWGSGMTEFAEAETRRVAEEVRAAAAAKEVEKQRKAAARAQRS